MTQQIIVDMAALAQIKSLLDRHPLSAINQGVRRFQARTFSRSSRGNTRNSVSARSVIGHWVTREDQESKREEDETWQTRF